MVGVQSYITTGIGRKNETIVTVYSRGIQSSERIAKSSVRFCFINIRITWLGHPPGSPTAPSAGHSYSSRGLRVLRLHNFLAATENGDNNDDRWGLSFLRSHQHLGLTEASHDASCEIS